MKKGNWNITTRISSKRNMKPLPPLQRKLQCKYSALREVMGGKDKGKGRVHSANCYEATGGGE